MEERIHEVEDRNRNKTGRRENQFFLMRKLYENYSTHLIRATVELQVSQEKGAESLLKKKIVITANSQT